MKISIAKTEAELGIAAASKIAELLNRAISTNGKAHYLVSTGASQYSTFDALLKEKVDWTKVTMFHLDEYIGLPATHPASFQKYLRERFVSKVPLKRAVFINGVGDIAENIRMLNEDISAHPIDVGVIGIGENAHIAFNDPPADFNTEAPFHVVALDDACKAQQVGEGWFASLADVPSRAISITPKQIMRCRHIISPVPGARKARAIKNTLEAQSPNVMIPASLLKTHERFFLFLDRGSASECPEQ